MSIALAAKPAVGSAASAHLEGALAIGGRALLVGWRDLGEAGGTRRWRAMESGSLARPPRAGLALPSPDGRSCLQLLMSGLPATGRLTLETTDAALTVACDLATAPPLALGELARGLGPAHRRRLATWLLGLCPGLFRLTGEPDLGFLTRDLIRALLPNARPQSAARRCRLLGPWTLLETIVADETSCHLDAFVLDAGGHARRAFTLPADPVPVSSSPRSLFVAVDDRLTGGSEVLVLVGSRTVTFRRVAPTRGRLPEATEWVNAAAPQQRPAARASVLDSAALLAVRNGPAAGFAALVAEVRLLAPVPLPLLPGRLRATLGCVVVRQRQLLAAARLSDPDDVVASLRLRRVGSPPIDIGRSDWVASHVHAARGELAFVAAKSVPAPPANPHAPWRAAIVLRSGVELPIGEATVASEDSALLAELLDTAWPLAELPAALALLEPVIRQLAVERAGSIGIGSVHELGSPLLRPRASLALPFRSAAAAERAVAMLAAEPSGRSVDLVLIAMENHGGMHAEAARVVARYARAVRLVMPTAPLAPDDVPKLALQVTAAPALICLGPGVVPRVGGWLDALLFALGPGDVTAHGVELALAGLPLAGGSGPLPSLQVAAALRPAAVAGVGGMPADWLDAEHRDADLALRLLAAGYRVRMLAGPACLRCAGADGGRDAPGAALAAALDTRRLAARAAAHRRAACGAADDAGGSAHLAIAI